VARTRLVEDATVNTDADAGSTQGLVCAHWQAASRLLATQLAVLLTASHHNRHDFEVDDG
jgi:hypothetical protein